MVKRKEKPSNGRIIIMSRYIISPLHEDMGNALTTTLKEIRIVRLSHIGELRRINGLPRISGLKHSSGHQNVPNCNEPAYAYATIARICKIPYANVCVLQGPPTCIGRCFLRNVYGASIASDGQTSTQAPQSVQVSASITYLPSPSLIASTGHSLSHAPQEMHSSLIV